MNRKNRNLQRIRLTRFEPLESRRLLAGDWQNPGQPLDVNDDLEVVPGDILLGINRLNQMGPGALGERPADSSLPYYDTNGDGSHTSNDILVGINALNSLRPLIAARLSNDTAPLGATNRDWISSDPALAIRVTASGDVSLRAGFEGTLPEDFVDVTATLQNGRFEISEAQLATIQGQPLDDGQYTLQVQATDSFGADSTVTRFQFTFDRAGPTATARLSDTERVTSNTITVGFDEALAALSFDPANFSLVIEGGSNDGQAVPIVGVESAVSAHEAVLNFAAHLPDQSYRLTGTADLFDLAGNRGSLAARSFTVADPTGVARVSPAAGEDLVSVTRETIVRFDEPIDPATLTTDALQVIANGQRIPGRIVVSSTERFATFFYDAPLPASTEVRVVVDGDLILGRDGLPLDANGDNEPGGTLAADFRTLPLTRIAETNVFGFVRDSLTGNPIVGATIRVDAFPAASAVTDETGRFVLEDMPAPEFFVHIDGTTATNAPAGFTYPNVGKPFHSVPGREIQLEKNGQTFDIFLPPLALGDAVPLSPTETTNVGFGTAGMNTLTAMFPDIDPALFAMMSVEFAPGAAVDSMGNAATEATIIPVPPDRLPAPLPENLNPDLVVSIQAGGATNFDVPAPATFPNLEGLAPGEQSLIFSFDHDAGAWVVIGTGTVSEDGMMIASDEGVGILAPGWHFVISGTVLDVPLARSNFYVCGSGDDFAFADHPSVGFPLNLLVGATDLFPAGLLEANVGLYVRGIGGATGSQLFNNFVAGGGTSLPFPDGSELSNAIKASETFDGLRMRIADAIEQDIQQQANGGSIDNRNIFIPPVLASNRSYYWDSAFLAVTVGSIQGTEISMRDFSASGTIISPEVGGSGSYSATLHFEMCDDFGVGLDDISGVRAGSALLDMWVLQHLKSDGTNYQPFQVNIGIDVTISGDFTIPPGYEDIEINIDNSSPFTAPDGESPLALNGDAPGHLAGLGSDPTVYYRVDMGDTEVAGSGSLETVFNQIVLVPDRFFTLAAYQPSTQRSVSISGVSSSSGRLTSGAGILGSQGHLQLSDVGGVDSDHEGIPDIGEYVLGTNARLADTDGDGITDAAEIAQGLDPLGGRAFPTGIVASLPLLGPAKGVASVGEPDNPEARSVFVATGSHGLAIVDTARFDTPIVRGQLDLPGDNVAVAVEPVNSIALVASTVGLHRVDVSDPMAPTLLQTLDLLGGTKVVEVFGETAYAGNGNTVVSFDVVSGERIDTIRLGVTEVTGLVREGSILFAMQANGTLSSLDVSTFDIQLLDSLNVDGAGGQVFAGNNIVYATGVSTGQGGYLTVDAGDPADLQLLADHGIPFGTVIPGHAFVANGSGLGVLIGSGGGGHFLELMDASDPENNFIRRGVSFNLPTSPLGVALGGGLAFVADGTSGLQVVNMLPFDADGNPPTVTLTAPPDADPGTSGVQIVEGSTIPLVANVSDDVQVRNVQLLLDGQPLANSLAFPWNLSIPPQTFTAGGANQIVVQVRAVDTGGNAALSEPMTLEIVPDIVAPTVVRQTPADGSVRTLAFRTVRISFSELMDVAMLTAANIRVVPSGGGAAIVPEQFDVRDEGLGVQINYPELTPGDYVLELQADALTDRAGNALGAGVQAAMFTIIDSQLPEIELVDLGAVVLGANDDGSTGRIDLGFDFDFFGRTFDSFYINNNGNVTFDNSLSAYTAEGFPQGQPIIAPFWADVDTGGAGSGLVHLNQGINERGNAFVQVTWDRVGYYSERTDKLNDFTLYIEDDVAGDIVAFIYREMQWTTGSASGGTDGFGGSPAQIGFDSGDGESFLSLLRPSTAEEVADLSNRDFIFRLTEEFLGSDPF